MRVIKIRGIGLTMAVVTLTWMLCGSSLASGAGAMMTADGALQKLMEGNTHYVADKLTNQTQANAATRAALAKSQKPYAIILTCSDSRVPPELIFDKGLGEIFVIRVAGNVPDPIVLGSIEYAAEHLGSPLMMVLGHERCGAVTAAVETGEKSTGSPNIDAIVKEIKPSVEQAAHDCALCKDDKNCAETQKKGFVECVIESNAKAVADNLTKESAMLRHLVEAKKLTIVAAKYDLDDGKVSLL
ncbi:MAG: carbonic anhydrase [Desulfobulbus sp.]|nr:carbonic anhydrase [Desulfobulbus sp.]